MSSSVYFTSQKQYVRFFTIRGIIQKHKYCMQIFPNYFTVKV